jgi:hypothetical protein
MNLPRPFLTAAAVVALGTAFNPASAGNRSSSDDTLPVDIVRGTISGHAYQNGGISKEQVADMVRQMNPYDLQLTFSEGKHNSYVTGLKLQITNAAGQTVFSLAGAGPLTDVDLPAGHYRVVGDFGGVKRGGSVEVKKGEHAQLYLHWPRDET